MTQHSNIPTSRLPVIGVLALQGCVDRHRPHIEAAGACFCAVKTPEEFEQVDALILPGGESTTMLKLIETFELEEPLKKAFAEKPVWGVCAGSILMAETVYKNSPPSLEGGGKGEGVKARKGDKDSRPPNPNPNPLPEGSGNIQRSFGLLPITMERNSYGRQLDSRQVTIDGYQVSLIRAPRITAMNDNIEILAEHDGGPVWLRSGQYMVTTFHPELTLDYPSPMHRAFVGMVGDS